MTKRSFYSLLEANPYLDKIITIEKKVSEALSDLRKERYACLIDLHKNLRSWQVRAALGAKSLTFEKLNFEKWLLVNFKINRLPDVHIVDRYFDAVETLGVVNDGEGLDYFLPSPPPNPLPLGPAERGEPNTQYHIPNPQFTVFAIGAAHATKRLPTEKIISICRNISMPVVLIGGRDVAPEGEEIARKSGDHVTNLCGQLNLHESAALIRDAAKVITHDTGTMHIAAAFQKDIISIWGNTIPEFGMYPYYKKGIEKNTTIEVKGLSCRPCSKIGFEKCPKGHFRCMKAISEKEFLDKPEL